MLKAKALTSSGLLSGRGDGPLSCWYPIWYSVPTDGRWLSCQQHPMLYLVKNQLLLCQDLLCLVHRAEMLYSDHQQRSLVEAPDDEVFDEVAGLELCLRLQLDRVYLIDLQHRAYTAQREVRSGSTYFAGCLFAMVVSEDEVVLPAEVSLWVECCLSLGVEIEMCSVTDQGPSQLLLLSNKSQHKRW